MAGDISGQEEGFLRAIRENPEDEDCLIYADWLEDQGQSSRAEFVRVQCELAKLPEGHPRQHKLVVRERRLLSLHGTEWIQPVADLVKRDRLAAVSGSGKARKVPEDIAAWGVVFRRGVIDELIVPARELPAEASKLENLPTLRALGVRDICGNVRLAAQLAALPLLRRIESLRFEEPNTHHIWTAALLQLMPASEGFNYWAGLGVAGLQRILESPHLKGLRTLELPNNWLNDSAGEALARATELRDLRFLNLTGNNITAEDLRPLADAEHLMGLQRLDLRDTHLGREGSQALREARFLRNLVELDLSESRLMLAGVQELFSSVPLAGLKVLKLNRLTEQTGMAQALVKCSGLRNLEVLELSWNRIGDQGAKVLAECPHLSNLKVLGLRWARLTLEGVKVLATSPHLKKLQVLDLGGNTLRPKDQKHLRSRFGKDFGIF